MPGLYDFLRPTGQRGGTGGGTTPIWQQQGFGSLGAARNDSEARRRRGLPQTQAPLQRGFLGDIFGRREGYQDPYRTRRIDEPRALSYADRGTLRPQEETAWDKWIRERGDPRIGGSGAWQPSGPATPPVGAMQNFYDVEDVGGGRSRVSIGQRPGRAIPPEYRGGAGGVGTGAAPTFGEPPTAGALAMRDELDVTPRWLQERYGHIADFGALGQQGIRDIDAPAFTEEERILNALQPFIDEQTGLYRGQTRGQLEQIRDQGADRRRRATRAAGMALGRTTAQRPGLAAQFMAEAAAPVTAAQAGLEFQAGQRGTEQELQLGAGAFDLANQIFMGRGGRRSGLERENILSKSQVGLPGVERTSRFTADLLGSRYDDLTNPLQDRFSFQSGMANLQQGLTLQRDRIQQGYRSMNADQQQEFRLELAQFQHDLGADDRSWGSFMDFLGIGGQAAGAIFGGPAGLAAATAATEALPE